MTRNEENNPNETKIIDSKKMANLVGFLAEKIVQNNSNLNEITLVGIRNRGSYLAKRISEKISANSKTQVSVGILDITLYRDDLRSRIDQPKLLRTEISTPVEGRNIILVDDVLFTGRTIRAAMDGIMDIGRPKKIQLAVLVDRGHRELPIRANYTGEYVATALEQTVRVRFSEDGEEDAVIVRHVDNQT